MISADNIYVYFAQGWIVSMSWLDKWLFRNVYR